MFFELSFGSGFPSCNIALEMGLFFFSFSVFSFSSAFLVVSLFILFPVLCSGVGRFFFLWRSGIGWRRGRLLSKNLRFKIFYFPIFVFFNITIIYRFYEGANLFVRYS